MKDGNKIGVIILAAGSSSRMGQSKQLLDIEGEPLLRRTTRVALSSKPAHSIVVLGSNNKEHNNVIKDLPVEIISNPNWQKGIGSSLKMGLHYLIQIAPQTEAAIILVCDQPLLKTDHIQKLKRKFELTRALIVASAYANTLGVPALFEKSMFQSLSTLADDQGAKKIIQQNLSHVAAVPFPEGVVDLDTPTDYVNFTRS